MALYYCPYCDCNNPTGNLDSSSSAQLHLGKGSEFCFRFRAKLWMGVGQDPKLFSENTMQCYMVYFTILFVSMWLSNGSQMEGTMQHEMGVTRFDHPQCDREAIWQKRSCKRHVSHFKVLKNTMFCQLSRNEYFNLATILKFCET